MCELLKNQNYKNLSTTEMRTLRKLDEKMGKQNEYYVDGILEKYFNKKIYKFKNYYSVFDFYTEEGDYIELKSRRTTINNYPTQLIGANKIDKAKQLLKEKKIKHFYLVYKLNDGIYIWDYDPIVVLQTKMLGNWTRGDKSCELYLIPNILLTKIK
tara:strand:- start:16559 stop:17026 length:468 start_codon:yes stop_codon:yes gene_type:complete